jgi:ankyrin repeat protein
MEAKDFFGLTPLHWAAWEGHIEIARLLCDRGADFEASTNSEMRPLHFAAKYGHISIVNELIEVRNAYINAKKDDGRTAL